MINKIKNKVMSNNVLKNTLILFSGQSFASVIGIFNTILLIKAVGVDGNGFITLIIAYSNLFNGILNFQSYNAVIKYGTEALEEKLIYKYKQVLKQAFIQDVLTAILAFIFGFLCVEVVSQFMGWSAEIIYYVKVYLITILMNVTGTFTGILRLHDNFLVIATINVKTSIFRLILTTIGLINKFDFGYYVIIEVVLMGTSSLLLLIESYKTLRKVKCEDFLKVKIKFDKEFTKFNFYNNIVSTIDLPVGQLVTFIINKLVGVTEVGIYSILLKLSSLIYKITEPMGQALLPELSKMVAKGMVDKSKNIVKKIFIYTNILGVGAIIVLSILSPVWFRFFMPFTTKNLILFISYMMYTAFTSSVIGIHLFFISMNLVKYNLYIVVIVNIIYLILVVILGMYLGLFGIIMALMIQTLMISIAKIGIIKVNKI